ncbi:hypothetical protein [Streptomyces sp. NPDC053755]|uniref:hypothetical protein n=1 Tax=Streptomyces sp. NPDC053755 TaxID=3155815 RepID=UPI003439D5AA
MDIPVAFRWVLTALVVLQLLSLYAVLRRMRRRGPGRRAEERWDVLDGVSGVALLAGILIGSGPLMICGTVLMGCVIALKAIRFLRTTDS